LEDKTCEGLDEESEEDGEDRISDTEEKRLREEAVYEKIMVSLQNEFQLVIAS
jgi:GTPase Era involved in 16S rRNA processing